MFPSARLAVDAMYGSSSRIVPNLRIDDSVGQSLRWTQKFSPYSSNPVAYNRHEMVLPFRQASQHRRGLIVVAGDSCRRMRVVMLTALCKRTRGRGSALVVRCCLPD